MTVTNDDRMGSSFSHILQTQQWQWRIQDFHKGDAEQGVWGRKSPSGSPRNRRRPPPPPVDEAPSRSQVDEPSTRRRLSSVPPPPLTPPSRRLNASLPRDALWCKVLQYWDCMSSVSPSVCPSVTLVIRTTYRLEILETNCTDN